MTVKRAHMVSKGYLTAWANERGLVHVWDAEKLVSGVRPVGDATVVRYAYRTELIGHNLEAEYGRIESRATPALRNLATGGSLTSDGEVAVLDFLDMHQERGQYADQAEVRIPVAAGNIYAGSVSMEQMGLGDRLTLARDTDTEAVRVSSLGVKRWRWRVLPVDSGLATGDGAVMLWRKRSSAPISAVSFPVSPTRLLILGDGLDGLTIPLNTLLMSNCRRWLVDHVDGNLARVAAFR